MENNTEQAADTVSVTVNLGKFDSVESLMVAYANLEREFTKKCQRLSEVEANLDNCEKEPQPEDAEEKQEVAEEQITAAAELQTKELSDEDILELLAGKDNIRDKIIAEYLYQVVAEDGVRILSGRIGATPLTPPERPRSLREAKLLADRIMRE